MSHLEWIIVLAGLTSAFLLGYFISESLHGTQHSIERIEKSLDDIAELIRHGLPDNEEQLYEQLLERQMAREAQNERLT